MGDNFDPLSLHKYTYCGSDPINRNDPSGQIFNPVIPVWIAITIIASILVGIYFFGIVCPTQWGGRRPESTTEEPALTQAKALLSKTTLPAHLETYRDVVLRARFRVHADLTSRGRPAHAETSLYGHFLLFQAIHIDEESLKLSNELLVATLMHEAVHTCQWLPWGTERPAYQVESDTLRVLEVTGTVADLSRRFTNDPDGEWLGDGEMKYAEYTIKNPAIVPEKESAK